MLKSGIEYKISFLKLSSLFPLVILFFTLAIGNSSYSFASGSHQISFSQDHTRLSNVSDIKVLVTPIITKEKSNSYDPYSKYPFSEKTESETEDDKEDDKEDEHKNFPNPKFLFGDEEFKQGLTALVNQKSYKKSLLLYIFFHSWKIHLI